MSSNAALGAEVSIGAKARLYAADKAFNYLLGKDQPAKLGQVVKNVAMAEVTNRLIRDILQEDSRFECIDRRWISSLRVGESGRPFEQVLNKAFDYVGHCVDVEQLANEFAHVLSRDAGYFKDSITRFVRSKSKFFDNGKGEYGLTKWMLDVTSDEESDVLFDNSISRDKLTRCLTGCPEPEWDFDDYVSGVVQMVEGCPGLLLNVCAFLAWRSLKDDFEPSVFYSQITSSDKLIVLSDQTVFSASVLSTFSTEYNRMVEELAQLPEDIEEEESDEVVTVTDTDKEEIVSLIISRGSASAEELLEAVLEVSPGESAYPGALESLKEALEGEDRIMWLGGTRWSKAIVFPEEIYAVPESLNILPVLPFETPEGDMFDQMLEEEGLEGDLKAAIYDPLAEDVLDEDPARTMSQHGGDEQRCVLKYHHKLEGTFPLCQISPDFFGSTPAVIPITLIDEGKRKTCFVNNETRLIYGLKDFYTNITDVSGAVFYISKTPVSGEYRFRYDGESDPNCGIDTNRSLELLDLKARYESQEMPVYDVVREILGKQGMTFVRLQTEVNIVRRCERLLIASLLSSYHCFSTRGKSGIWQFDSKKESQGFNKNKKKYIKK